jgi:hypothetical protein
MEKIVGVEGVIIYILLVFPLYQILLMVYGTLLGQFTFFWKWEKKILTSIASLFKRRH